MLYIEILEGLEGGGGSHIQSQSSNIKHILDYTIKQDYTVCHCEIKQWCLVACVT